MVYLNIIKIMRIYKKILILFFCTLISFFSFQRYSFSQNQVNEFDSVRTSILEQGSKMPEIIKNAKTNMEIRTLERIYELNTSLLVTIESYFRMLRLVITSEIEVNSKIIETLNGWLVFMGKQCDNDLEYLESAVGETKNLDVIEQVRLAGENIKKLKTAIDAAMEENMNVLSKTSQEIQEPQPAAS